MVTSQNAELSIFLWTETWLPKNESYTSNPSSSNLCIDVLMWIKYCKKLLFFSETCNIPLILNFLDKLDESWSNFRHHHHFENSSSFVAYNFFRRSPQLVFLSGVHLPKKTQVLRHQFVGVLITSNI